MREVTVIMVTIEDFKKLELVVSRIVEVNDHPDADKLYLLKVDTGKDIKQLVAGIKPSYQREELIGKQIIIIVNLEPAVIRGQESQGMLLAASDEQGIAVLSPERDVALGSSVR